MIDTHCHLTFPDFAGRVRAVLDRAACEGIRGVITISTTTRDCLEALALAEQHPDVWCTAGVHPLYSDRGTHEWANLGRVIRQPRCVAWGELGLDNHYEKPARETQRRILEEQLAYIESCRRGTDGGGPPVEKPVVLHCREAFADLIPVLRATSLPPDRFVFHCFTGGPDDMRLLLDFGAYVSFTGVLTYPNAPEVRAAAVLAPIDRIMVETDAPFLTPHPHRGVRPNEPRFAAITASCLAELRGMTLQELEPVLNNTTRRFFGIDA